ncbi:MAG: Uncharacterised protein [Polaribacter sejongensis]|nr:MAG: Uncharacterised protein [Polaribacter sejongensis]
MNSALNFKYQDKPSLKQGVMTLHNNKVSLYSAQFGKKLIYNAKIQTGIGAAISSTKVNFPVATFRLNEMILFES